MKNDLLTAGVGWINAGVTIAAVQLDLRLIDFITISFVTVPVGIWSWLRLLDTIKARRTKNVPTPKDTE